MDNPKKLLKVEQLAELLQVPKSWIYDRTRQGPEAIPFIKMGAYVRFDAEEVINFFKKNGRQSIITHPSTETTTPNGTTNHFRSGEQIQAIHPLSSHTTGCRTDQGQIGGSQQKNKSLAHLRRFPPKVHAHQAQKRPPQESLNIAPHYGIISSSKGGMPNGGI